MTMFPFRVTGAAGLIFPLPIAAVADASAAEELRNDIRIAQSATLIRQMPMILAGNGLGSLIGYFALSSVGASGNLIALPTLMSFALAPMFWSWTRLMRSPLPKAVSVRRIRRIVAYSGALGLLWGAMEICYLPAAPFDVAAFLMVGCAYLSVGAVAALSALPWACLAYATPMMIAAAAIAAGCDHPAHLAMTLLLVLMSIGLFWFLRQNWLNFTALMQTVWSERRMREEHASFQAELQRVNESLSMLAATDALTGLPNRRQFDRALSSEWRRARRGSKPVSLLMIDIDYFKELNDRVGHAAGDDCLRRIAAAIQANVKRSGDLAARYGGEEFAAILPETEARDALVVAERIRRAVEGLNLAYSATVSIGVTTVLPDSSLSAEKALAIADEALYEAKQGGRNLCVAKIGGARPLRALQ
jgi:diguanylate cyclase (GGDEF)-like protein